MKKMYTFNPVVDLDESNGQSTPADDDQEKRIKKLESKISQMAEQMNRLVESLGATRRNVRRQSTDIANLTTAFRNR